jgi:myo-inositol-1(or 4)-monophosphatase
MNWSKTRDVAAAAALDAGRLLRQGLHAPKTISRKSSEIDLLTEYDRAAEALIASRLREAFPGHELISEEDGHPSTGPAAGSPYRWYVDPLDGTINFAHGLPNFAVSIALYEENRPRVAVVYDPMRDECFSAIAGGGAELLGGGERLALRVSDHEDLIDCLLASGFPYDRHHSPLDNLAHFGAFLKRAQGLRKGGSAALDLAYVAAGRLDGYWELELSSWDVAAGVLLVTEAGGRVSGVDGRAFRIGPQVSLVASNGRIHETMLAVLAADSQEG